jgi:DNA-binding transcriptional LysR family regulator
MRSLNLDQLRTLITVVELGSFSAAAQRLNLSQPAVSLHVRELESRLGLGLIERLGKKAYATTAGRDLLEHARRLMHEEETALASMRRHREGLVGRVRVGTNAHYLIYSLPPVLRRLRAEFPMVELVITTGTTRGIIELMQRNEIDVGLVTLPVDERAFAVTHVRTDPIFAVLPKSYDDIPERVTPAYAGQHPLIVEYERSSVGVLVGRWVEAGGVTARAAMEFDNVEALVIVVAAGLGMSFVDDLPGIRAQLANADVALRPLDPPLERSIGVVVRRDKPDEPALAIVRDALLALAEPGIRTEAPRWIEGAPGEAPSTSAPAP